METDHSTYPYNFMGINDLDCQRKWALYIDCQRKWALYITMGCYENFELHRRIEPFYGRYC